MQGSIMKIGRSIRIYLDDGSISGIKHAEIVNWTGQAISAPRTQIKNLTDWDESKKPGVYFLFGVDEISGGQAVYIGEAENVLDRLQNHVANKDFWNEVVFFTNKDENLTKSHVKYLESGLIQLAKKSGRYVILNGNEPQLPVLPRGDRDAMEEFISNLKTLLGVMGHKALEPLAKHEYNIPKNTSDASIEKTLMPTKQNIELVLKVKNLDAKSILSNEGLVVLAGSKVCKEVKESLSQGYKQFREHLIEIGVLIDNGDYFVFQKDQLFTSSSQAAAIIAGYPMNGRSYWKTTSGITLKTLEESDVASSI